MVGVGGVYMSILKMVLLVENVSVTPWWLHGW